MGTLLFVFFIVSPSVTELVGTVWHWRVSHMGVLRWLFNDFLCARHYHHHMKEYPETDLQSEQYHSSCDATFYPLAVFVLIGYIGIWLGGFISLTNFFALLVGSTIYGVGGLDLLHRAYHIREATLKEYLIVRIPMVWKTYIWLREYHRRHHEEQGNYSILIPLDVFLRTLVTKTSSRSKDLFPGFDPDFMSSCEHPIIIRA